ncbi:alpha/beta hydrolase family protein [Longispora albida]|uniref:alpha/beta hydrolase family protein n=1 Tax=Longispora albida TaxID=203523 RepID=UPI00036E0C56|nr:hypothetical protein [Longispora albida]
MRIRLTKYTRATAVLALAGLLVSGIAAPAAAFSSAPPALVSASSHRGQLIRAELIRTLSKAEEVSAFLSSDEFDGSQARYGVDVYRVTYWTIDVNGRRTTASGLLALPRNRQGGLTIVSYAHGTATTKADAPSTAGTVWAEGPAVMFASAGYAAVAPDYLGMGTGPGHHPWMHVPSEATASLDLLRAARDFTPRIGRQVLATGFSQGASAAIGLARVLEDGRDPWFRLRAVAPISGAYDFRGVELPALLGGQVPAPWDTVYLTYLLVSWNRLHHLYDDPAQVLTDPAVENLFDGLHTGPQIFAALPKDADGMPQVRLVLTPYAIELLRNPPPRLAAALADLDATCMTWTPRAAVTLYYGDGDNEALNANTEHCAGALRSHGANVSTVDVGTPDHSESNKRGTAAAVRWFRTL